MPSASSSLIQTLFGCCWGNRDDHLGGRGGRRLRETGSDGVHHGPDEVENDERTPLIGGQKRFGTSRSNGNNKATSNKAGNSSLEVENEANVVSRKKSIDVAKLRAIRDRANDAFFYVENSQLLPSSSSSRPMSVSVSQLVGGGATANKRNGRKEGTALHQKLVIESDKAERLYRAAMSSPLTGEAGEEILTDTKDAPLSLVRQMQISIREAARHDRILDVSGAEQKDNKKQQQQQKTSASSQQAHAKMGLDVSPEAKVEELQARNHTINRLPSLHSLRTLRLSAQDSPPLLSSEKNASLDQQFGAGEEDWSQRGRTRSKRGLAWIDSGPSKEALQSSGKVKLNEIFNQESQQAKVSEAEVEAVAAADENNDDDEVQVPNALRLTSKQTETMKDIQDRLKATTSIAEVWEDNQDD